MVIGWCDWYENYSDFGSVATLKLATRYKVASNFNVRGLCKVRVIVPLPYNKSISAIHLLHLAEVIWCNRALQAIRILLQEPQASLN